MKRQPTRILLSLGLLLGAIGLLQWHTSQPTPVQAAPLANTHPDNAVPPGTWPMFGNGPCRNMVNYTEKNIPDKFDPAEESDIKWKQQLGSRAYGGPVVAGGKVFVGTNNESSRNPRDREKSADPDEPGRPIDKGILMCFDEATGKFLWQAVHDKLGSGPVNDWPREGLCSTPIVEGNRIYYVSNRCTVVCADVNGFADGNDGIQTEKYKSPTDADIIWELDMMKELNVFPHNMSACAPMIVGDILFVVTANGVDEGHINIPSPEAPSFIAVDKKTGKLLWKDNSPGKNIMHGQWSNPTYAVIGGQPQVIFPGGDGWLYGFVPETGELLWKFDANPKGTKYILGGKGEKSDFIGTPVVYKEKIYIGTGQDPEHYEGIGHFWCIDPKGKRGDISPTLVTKYDADGKPLDEKPNPNSGAVWHYGGPETRELAKRDYIFGRTMSTATIIDDVVYIAELAGYIHCLDARTGKKYWQYDLKGSVWGSTMYIDGKIYIANEDGDLYIFRHFKDQQVLDVSAAKDEDEIKRIKSAVEKKYLLRKIAFDEPIRSTPIAVNGVLYVMTEKTLFAIGGKK